MLERIELSERNQYLVRAYIDGLQEIEAGTQVGDYEFGFDTLEKQHFLSTVVTAKNTTEAIWTGEMILSRILSIFTLYTGMPYHILHINGELISNKEPHLKFDSRRLEVVHYAPFDKNKIEEIRKAVGVIERLPYGEHSTEVAFRAVNYFERGCYLEKKWRSESFLNFYKVVELISYDFRKHFDREVSNLLKNTLLGDFTKEDLKEMRTSKRLIQVTCEQLGITECAISEIVKLRSRFIAHARLEELNVTKKEFSNCKELAEKLIISYVNYVSPKNNSPTP